MANLKQTILGFIGDRMLETARVAGVRSVSKNFRVIELESESFKKSSWKPGEKLQLNAGDWHIRTYTPIALDVSSSTPRLTILAYLHGNGPGSRWASEARVGHTTQVLGPRPSLALDKSTEPAVLFGDETSIGVALTLQKKLGEKSAFVFQVNDVNETNEVLKELGLTKFVCVDRSSAGTEKLYFEVAAALEKLGTQRLILTGHAFAIRDLRARLRETGFPFGQTLAKAYWAEGKVGID